jgi:hypothetical protein
MLRIVCKYPAVERFGLCKLPGLVGLGSAGKHLAGGVLRVHRLSCWLIHYCSGGSAPEGATTAQL